MNGDVKIQINGEMLCYGVWYECHAMWGSLRKREKMLDSLGKGPLQGIPLWNKQQY